MGGGRDGQLRDAQKAEDGDSVAGGGQGWHYRCQRRCQEGEGRPGRGREDEVKTRQEIYIYDMPPESRSSRYKIHTCLKKSLSQHWYCGFLHSFPDGVEGGVKTSLSGAAVLLGAEPDLAAEVLRPLEVHAALRHGPRGQQQPRGGARGPRRRSRVAEGGMRCEEGGGEE